MPLTPPTPTPKKRKTWLWILAIAAALFIGISLGHASAPSPVAAPISTYGQTGSGSLPAVPAPTYASAPTYVPDAEASGPLTTFSDGTYAVGTGDGQVAPGKYKSPGPGYYALLKDTSNDIIANKFSEGQLLLTVPKTAAYVEVTGCTFTKVG